MVTFDKNIENQRQPAFAMDNPELFGEHPTQTLFKNGREQLRLLIQRRQCGSEPVEESPLVVLQSLQRDLPA